jgi:hypothetical protein
MSGHARRTILAIVGVGLFFVVVLIVSRELFGGRSLSFWLENTGGVWFIAAYVVGYLTGKAIPGAFSGVAALLVALFLYDSISMVTSNGFGVQFSPLIRTVWVGASVVVGAIFGFLGGWTAEDRADRWFGASVLGGLLAGEPVALFIGGPPHPAFDSGVAALQIFAGTGVMLVGTRGRVRATALAVFLAVSVAVIVVELTTGVITTAVWG